MAFWAAPMPPPSAPTRRDLLSLLSVAGVPLIAAGALRGWEELEDRQRTDFDQAWLDKLASRRAEIALIGNSMVFHRLDAGHLESQISPMTTMTIAKGGWRSLAWLLGLKNLAAACVPPPRLAIVVYRDYDFANPTMNIERRYLREIRAMMKPGDQPLLDMARDTESGAGWRAGIEDLFEPDAAIHFIRNKLTNFAYDGASVGTDEDVVRTHTDQVFDLDQLRPEIMDAGGAASDSVDDKHTLFTADPDANYLTRFVEIAKAKQMKLIFYRVKRRPDETNVTVQSDALRDYTADFKAWAESQGCVHLDETEDPAITLSMFRDGDHLHEAVQLAYTDLFIQRIRAHLPEPFSKTDIRAAKQGQEP